MSTFLVTEEWKRELRKMQPADIQRAAGCSDVTAWSLCLGLTRYSRFLDRIKSSTGINLPIVKATNREIGAGIKRGGRRPGEPRAMPVDKSKLSIYLPEDLLVFIEDEAKRLDRTYSWIIQRSLRIAMKQIRQIPSFADEKDER